MRPQHPLRSLRPYRSSSILIATAILVTIVGCDAGPHDEGTLDAEDGSFLDDAKADGIGITPDSAEARAVLDLVNHAGLARLDVDAKLDKRAATNIVARRPADGGYTTLAQLDAVPYVGKRVFQQLASYAQAHGFGRTWRALHVRVQSASFGALDSWDRMAVSNWSDWAPLEDVRALASLMEAEGLRYVYAFADFVRAANAAPGSNNDWAISGAEILGYIEAKHHVDALAISRVGLTGELRRDVLLLDWYVRYVALNAIDEPAFEKAYAVTDIDIVVDQPDVHGFSLDAVRNCSGVRAETCGWTMGDRSLVAWTVPVACLPAGVEKWARRAPRLRTLIEGFGVIKVHTDWNDTYVTTIGLANDAYWFGSSNCRYF